MQNCTTEEATISPFFLNQNLSTMMWIIFAVQTVRNSYWQTYSTLEGMVVGSWSTRHVGMALKFMKQKLLRYRQGGHDIGSIVGGPNHIFNCCDRFRVVTRRSRKCSTTVQSLQCLPSLDVKLPRYRHRCAI